MINLIIIYTNIKEVEHASFDLFPFSIYLGWVSVAAIADISYYLTYISWKGFEISNVTWTIVMMIAATILAFVFAVKNRDWCYPLVLVWAFNRHWCTEQHSLPDNHPFILHAGCSNPYLILHHFHQKNREIIREMGSDPS
ncbi:hypothetical protein NST21_02800 [Peribacillus sp. FSL K6-1552]|uniref:hypothetical protein n=1 Tax=Peribacillus TaxID=2675229 RepID=UPI0030F9AA59